MTLRCCSVRTYQGFHYPEFCSVKCAIVPLRFTSGIQQVERERASVSIHPSIHSSTYFLTNYPGWVCVLPFMYYLLSPWTPLIGGDQLDLLFIRFLRWEQLEALELEYLACGGPFGVPLAWSPPPPLPQTSGVLRTQQVLQI